MPNRWEIWTPEEMLRELEVFEASVQSTYGIRLPEIPDWRRLTEGFLDLISGFHQEIPEDARNWIEAGQNAMGVFDIAAKYNKVADHPAVPALRNHFELFLSAAGILQNIPSPPTDQETNKIFELLITLMVMQFSDVVTVEDPVGSSAGAPNPDVMFAYKGRTIGVACKAAHSRKGKSVADSVRRGVGQIHRAGADTGFVTVSLKNVWDNDQAWSHLGGKQYTAWDSVEQIDAAIEAFADELHSEVASDLRMDASWPGKTMPVIVYHLAPTVLIQLENGALPMTTVRRLLIKTTSTTPVPQVDADILDLLHRSAQRPFSGERGIYGVTDRVR